MWRPRDFDRLGLLCDPGATDGCYDYFSYRLGKDLGLDRASAVAEAQWLKSQLRNCALGLPRNPSMLHIRFWGGKAAWMDVSEAAVIVSRVSILTDQSLCPIDSGSLPKSGGFASVQWLTRGTICQTVVVRTGSMEDARVCLE